MGVSVVEVPAGRYELGEPGEERVHDLPRVLIGRWPVSNALVTPATTVKPRSV